MKPLTPRQKQIIELRLQGLMHKEIARKLGISKHTVWNQTWKAYDRLDIPKQGFTKEKLRMVRDLVKEEASA
jgi:DNA-binding NarL/FixJ family response regulator